MHRRQFLEGAGAAAGALGGTSKASVARGADGGPPGLAWYRLYDGLDVATVVPAHGGGHVVVNEGERYQYDEPLRVARIDSSGAVTQRRELDAPAEARIGTADVARTADGYAVAVGTWFAALDADLSVVTTGFAADLPTNNTARVAGLADGVAVASDGSGGHDRWRTNVLGFDADGSHRWTWEYGGLDDPGTTILGFLLDAPDSGVVVVGSRLGTGYPWLASLAADGTERWKTTVTGAETGPEDATRDGDGFTLVGHGGMLRLRPDRSIAWQRTYDRFAKPGHRIARTADGGYVFPTSADDPHALGLARTDAAGRLRWHHEYGIPFESAGDPDAEVTDVVERAPGEYLLVGFRDDEDGWAMLFSEARTPVPTPTPTPTATRTPATRSRPDGETGAIPGFVVGTALVGAAGLAAGWLARRRG